MCCQKIWIEYCFKKIHCDNYAGHLGQKKTIKKVVERFYRPKLVEEIKLLVRSCDVCQKIKRQTADKAEIQPIIPKRFNQIVAMDLHGPFKPTIRRNRFRMTMSDLFGK